MDSSPPDAPECASGADEQIRADPAASPRQISPAPALLLGFVAAAVYAVYSVLQWRLLVSPSWDLGIFTQLAKAYGSLSAPIVPIKGEGFNLLGDHFHPILVLLGPFYALSPSGLTLLIIQGVLFAASAAVVAHTASRLLGRAAGLLIGAAYAASWGLQSALASQFHEIAFAVPLLALSLSGLLLSRWRLAIIAAGALVFVKEDLGATVVVIGLVLAWRRGEARRQAAPADSGLAARLRRSLSSLHLSGLLLSAWGAVWLVLTVTVILPALNPGGQFDYGGRIAVGEILANPLAALGLLLVPAPKATTLLALLVIGAVVWVRSPLALIVVPTILWRFWADEQFYWSTDWHYSAILMPVVFLALVDVIDRRGPRLPGASRLADPLRSAPIAVVIVALALVPQHPLSDLGKGDTWRGADEARAAGAAAVLETIPDGATVVSDISLMAYLVPDHEVYWLGNQGDPAPDYIVVDRISASWSDGPEPADVQAESRHPGTAYEIILDAGGYQVAERR